MKVPITASSETIRQVCPACRSEFDGKKLVNKCPHCQVLTDLSLDGRATYAFVAPKPANGTAFTSTDLIREFTAPHTPDRRGIVKILKTVSIDDVCEESGMTPLLWAIENGAHFSYCLAPGASPSQSGTGDYDLSPVEPAVRKGNNDVIDTLVRHGAEAPQEVLAPILEKQDAQRTAILERGGVVRDVIARFKVEAKKTWYRDYITHLESLFGVSAKTARGRGLMAFAKVPLNELAAEAGAEVIDYLSRIHDEGIAAGVSIFCEQELDIAKKVRVLVAPTTSKLHVIAASNLMSPDDAMCLRIDVGRGLVNLDSECPFRILECGRKGILGDFPETPQGITAVARRLLEICPHYGSDLQAGRSMKQPRLDDLEAVENDIAENEGFYLSWD